jgi:hypothetical protein
MKLHNCPRCGYSTNILNCFKSHLQRKYKCKPKVKDIPITHLLETYNLYAKKEEPVVQTPLNSEINEPILFTDYLQRSTVKDITKGFLYMLREREFLKTGEKIYKVGKTTQDLYKRISKYPKNSELILAIKFDDCHTAETELLKRARLQFTPRRDIGSEYFEAEEKELMKLFYSLFD